MKIMSKRVIPGFLWLIVCAVLTQAGAAYAAENKGAWLHAGPLSTPSRNVQGLNDLSAENPKTKIEESLRQPPVPVESNDDFEETEAASGESPLSKVGE